MKAMAVLLALTMLVAVLPSTMITADALSYSGSSSYMSGPYYQKLIAVNLTGNQRVDVVNIANSQIGYKEGTGSSSLHGYGGSSSGSNYTEYGRWYNMQDMWCAMFVSWCAAVAGVSTSIIPKHAYTPSGLSWFQNRGQAYSRYTVANGGYTPIPGDVVYFKSSRNGNTTNHVGFVTGYSNGTLYTVEGNTSSATISTNGGGVVSKSYSISNTYIVYICKPAYTSGDSVVTSSWVNTFDFADGSTTKSNASVSGSYTLTRGDNFSIGGWSVHSDGVAKYQWNINNTSWGDMDASWMKYREDVANATTSYDNCGEINSFSATISSAGLNVGANTIGIRGVTKDGATYSIGTYNIFVYPADGETYMSVNKYEFPVDEGVTFSAKGANQYAWVGLFARDDVPGEVASYRWYEMGANEVIDINLMTDENSRANSRGEVTEGEYTLYLFVDKDYAVDTKIDITITAAEGAKSCLDFPNPKEFEVYQGDSIFSAGWALHNKGIEAFFYTIDGDTTKYAIQNAGVRTDIFEVYPDYATTCADLNYFSDYISTADWSIGTHKVVIGAVSTSGYEIIMGTLTVNVTTPPVRITGSADSEVVISRTDKLNCVQNIKPGLSSDEIKALFNEDCVIVDKDGNEKTDGIVGTGCKVRYYSGDRLDDELVIIVSADINGDGKITTRDILQMKKAAAGMIQIQYEIAADIDGDGNISANDLSIAVDLM